MSSQAIGKKTVTCFLCGGVHIYPGPRFGNHLLHEHGIVFNQEYIVQVSLYKSIHSSLPEIRSGTPKTALNQSTQTDLSSQASCSQCARPGEEFFTSTPIRRSTFHNPKYSSQPANIPSPSPHFSTPKNQSLTSNNKTNHFVKINHEASPIGLVPDIPVRSAPPVGPVLDLPARSTPPIGMPLDLPSRSTPPVGMSPDLPARSGFLCKCALCHFVTTDDTTFWGHITKKHGLNYKKYKEEHGPCQTATGSGMFQCFICQASIKHMPCSVDKHLKKLHGLNWPQYLARVKEMTHNADNGSVGTRDLTEASSEMKPNKLSGSVRSSEVAEVSSDLTMEESQDYLQPPEQTFKKSRPLNIKDKTTKYCSYCEVNFVTRMLFLKHCQDIHNLKFKTRSGAPVELDKTSSSLNDRKLTVNSRSEASPCVKPSYSSAHQSPSAQERVVSSSRMKPGEGAFPCEHCGKKFSSYSNMERHTRLSCPVRGGTGQKVIPVNVKPDAGVGAGFKCRKCGRVFTKLGNLNRHYISTCFSPGNQ